MTIAVAIVDGDSTVFGSDSEISLGNKRFPASMAERPSKWSFHGRWGICVSGDSAMGVLIDRHAERWMVKDTAEDVCDSLRLLFVEHPGFQLRVDPDGGSSTVDADMLLIRAGEAWHIDSAFNATPVLEWATGNGLDVALGALFASAFDFDASPIYRVRIALEASCEINRSCAPPLHIGRLSASGVEYLDTLHP